jgi:cobalt-precorrin-5B (C1)-methyltransferase
MDNDDLDVTRGCEIVVTLSHRKGDLTLNPIAHTPYTLGTLELYAGAGVGIVTRKGLKPPAGFPAINPAPLEAMHEIYLRQNPTQTAKSAYGTIAVTDGERIARQTANGKVGVLGGISILGTTGWVKPVSNTAYLDFLATEIGFAKANGYETVVLTLGNRALAYAKAHYEAAHIIEAGNFVHDAIAIAQREGIGHVHFVAGIAKGVKVMQGHRNTHNRFGTIDMEALCIQIRTHLGRDIDTDATPTVRGIVEQLGAQREPFYAMIQRAVNQQIQTWFPDLSVETTLVR